MSVVVAPASAREPAPGGALAAPAAESVAYVARVVEQFPHAEHWFAQAAGIRFHVDASGIEPDWSTVTHPRVLRYDTAGQRIMPRLPVRADGAMTVVLDGEPDFWARTVPLDVVPVAAGVADGLVVYRGAYGASDLFYKLTPTHVDEYVVVPDARAPHVFRYRLLLGPAVANVNATPERLELLDGTGASRLRLEHPFARDAKWERREGELVFDGDVITLKVDLTGMTYPIIIDPDWTTTGRMIDYRFDSAAVPLPGGDVLVAGGCTLVACPRGLGMPDCSLVMDKSERWAPATGTWRQAAPLEVARFVYAAATLPDGEVLVAGGCTERGCAGTTATVELYDPAMDVWMFGAPLRSPRAFATATTLPGGDVLVVGGCDVTGCTPSAEIYEVSTGSWRDAASLMTPRGMHVATALPGGRVLVAGGCTELTCGTVLDTAEVYDAMDDLWRPAGKMSSPRAGHTMTLLAGGDVLVTGGCPSMTCQPTLASADRWRTSGSWLVMPSMGEPRANHSASPLADGTVLIVGGCSDLGGCMASTELFDPYVGSWSSGMSLAVERGYQATTMLDDGRLLVAGGCNRSTCIPWADLYPPAATRPAPDGGPPPLPPDAGSSGYMPPPYVDQDCTCRVGGQTHGVPLAAAVMAVALLVVRRARRRA